MKDNGLSTGLRAVAGGVTAAKGFRAAGVEAGIKKAVPDMALLVSDVEANVAGLFTRNRVQAAPVRLCRERLAGGVARAVIVNSGNANACTGIQGRRDAARTAELTGEALGIEAAKVLVCSTGTIGIPMPMDRVASGIPKAVAALSPDGGERASRAIMTTDTVPKQAAVEFAVDGRTVRLGGMAKGAGMIEPDLATMLAFLTTDAAVDRASLQTCLREAADRSFNRITVDGDQSTNDTVLLLANGAAGNAPLCATHADWSVFVSAVRHVCGDLARAIVRDGEGATKFVTVTVRGAASDADAHRAARAVANSLLVKTSWYGEDPNWGRVIDSVGRSGADVREERVDIQYDGLVVVKGGCAAPGFRRDDLHRILAGDEFAIVIDLHAGGGTDTVYTCDCSEEYVKINADYTT